MTTEAVIAEVSVAAEAATAAVVFAVDAEAFVAVAERDFHATTTLI